MEYYLGMKRNGVLIQSTIWANLKNTVLNERCQTQKVTYCMIPCVQNVQKRYIYRDRRLVFAQCWDLRQMRNDCYRAQVFFWG